MPVSDNEFIQFYQNALLFIWDEGPDHIFWLTGWPDSEHDTDWYNQALSAIARMDFSGLITSTNETKDVLDVLRNTTDEDIWMRYIFELTDMGKKIAKQFDVPNATEEIQYVIPGFREALSRVFDEHGVGFDVELPYKMTATPS